MDELLNSFPTPNLRLNQVLSDGSKLSLQKSATVAYLQAQNVLLNSSLTPTEIRICFGLLVGLSAKEVARHRNCSYRTVENHIAKIKTKLNVKTLSPLLLANIIYFDSSLRESIELSTVKKIAEDCMDLMEGREFNTDDIKIFCRNCLVKWLIQEAAKNGVEINPRDAVIKVFSHDISI